MLDGMSSTSYRTTFALDAETARRLKKLAALWRVSQAEVVRRAVAQAEAGAETNRADPVTALHALHARGQGLDPKAAKAYLSEVRQSRKTWRQSAP